MNPIEITKTIREVAYSYGYHDLIVIVYYNQYCEAVIIETGNLPVVLKDQMKTVSQEILKKTIDNQDQIDEDFNCDGPDYFKVHVLKWTQGLVSLASKFNNPKEILEKSFKMLNISV